MQIIPLQPLPSQIIQVYLGPQVCQLNVYQKSTGMFMDVLVDNVLIIGGVLCLNLNKIVRSAYLGFIGDLAFMDLQGKTDPTYLGLGSRYVLAYLEPGDTV